MKKIVFIFALLVQGILSNPELTEDFTERLDLAPPINIVPTEQDNIEPVLTEDLGSYNGPIDLEELSVLATDDKLPGIPDNFEQTEIPRVDDSLSLPKTDDIEPKIIDSIDREKICSPLTPEKQIQAIKDKMNEMQNVVIEEFERFASYIMTPCSSRSKRDTSGMGTNKYLMRFLKHVRANNEKQNSVIDKMMTAEEMAEKYGIDLNNVVETRDVENMIEEMRPEASELCENVFEPFGNEEIPEDTVEELPKNEELTTVETTTQEIPITEKETTTIEPAKTEAPQQYYYQQNPPIYQSDDGSYYYYQLDAAFDTTTKFEQPIDFAPQTQLENFESSDQILYTPTILCNEETPMSYTPPQGRSAGPQQPVVAVVTQPEEQLAQEVISEQIEEVVTSEAVVAGTEEPRLKHINRSSTHRLSHMTVVPHVHALPQQVQYYFSLV